MEDTRTQLRQAAILIASLDQATADVLLDQFAPAEADMIRRMLVSLDEIDASEQDAVIGQFLGIRKPEAAAPQPQPPAVPEEPPFEFLRGARGDQILPLLEHEHPQTVAVVMSHLPPHRAAEVLDALSASLRSEVLRRLANLGETDIEILRDVERGLKIRIVDQVRSERRQHALAEILSAADDRAPQAALPRPVRRSFDDLERLSGAALRRLLAEADRQTTVLALAGASPSLVDRLLSELPLQEAQSLRLAWHTLGPTPLSDIEAAQQELAALADPICY